MKHAEAGGEGGSPGRTARQGSRGAIVPPIRRRHPNRARRADLPHRGAGLLEENGFGVVEAANADAALKLLETRDDVRLLFTDIQCPQCPARYDGMDLARQVHTRWPRILLIITSGQIAPAQAEIPDHDHFVGKPYRARDLLGEVNDMTRKA
jgi:two-component system, response regulator PdtaR